MEARCGVEVLEGRVLLTTIYVDAEDHNGSMRENTGVSWYAAYLNLQQALSAAQPGDTIKVAGGTYRPTATTDRAATLQLKNGVAIYGGYAGYGFPKPDLRRIETFVAILSGDIGVAGQAGDNSYHVVTGNGTDGSAILDGFTITAGNANGIKSQRYGGGMYNDGGSPTIRSVVFSNNAALQNGGAMYNVNSSSPRIIGCIFDDNGNFGLNLDEQGGAIANYSSSSPTIINSTFSDNHIGGDGGAIANYYSAPTIVNCVFSGNRANSEGGAIVNVHYSSPTVINATFYGNTAASGGAVANQDHSSPKVTNSILWGNTATSGTGSQIHSDYYSVADLTSSDMQGYPDVEDRRGNLNVDPLFVDAAGGDLRLPVTSPLVDAGSNAALPHDVADLDGDGNVIEQLSVDRNYSTRISGPAVDMGAYEFQVSPILFVNDDAPGSVHNGHSWGTAFTSLQSALAAAASGNEIWVAAGTYTPAAGDRAVSFELKNGVGLYGGFAGTETSRDQRNWRTYQSILSGNIGDLNSSSHNSYHVLKGSGVDASAVLDGFTITGGSANSGTALGSGGGMLNSNASPTVANCIFTRNYATWGGGMSNGNSSPSVINCSFVDNGADTWGSSGFGGGMYNGSSSPSLKNCTFIGNYAAGYYEGGGGGMYNESSSPSVTNCTFIGNSALGGTEEAKGRGGGMYNAYSSSPSLANCAFVGNSVRDGQYGSAAGGGMYNNYSSPSLVNCTFSGNSASGYDVFTSGGGAVYNDNYSLGTLTNCILWGDTTHSGGMGFTGDEIGCNYSASLPPTTSHSIVGDPDPQFIRNPSPGPDGIWSTPWSPSSDDDHGDVHLRLGSPAINAGSNAAVPAGLSSDLDGNPRICAGVVDVGAFENQTPVASIGGTAGDDRIYVRSDAGVVKWWINHDPASQPGPDGSLPAGQIAILSIEAGTGTDTVIFLGLSGAQALTSIGADPITYIRVEKVGLADGSVSLASVPAGMGLVAQGTAKVTLTASMSLPSLKISDTAVVSLKASEAKVLIVRSLSIGATAVLDLADNDMILTHGDADHGAGKVEQFRQWLRSALIGGGEASPWTGTGLTSTAARDNEDMNTAVAIFNNDDGEGNPWMESFNGIPVDQNSIILKYTYFGDSNADGQITADDFAAATAGWFDQMGGMAPTWMSGDYDYDGKVTADDFALVTGSWFSQDRSKPLSAVAPVAIDAAGVNRSGEGLAASSEHSGSVAAGPAGLVFGERRTNAVLVDDLAVLA